MKRVIAICLLCTMCFGLLGCSDGADTYTSNGNVNRPNYPNSGQQSNGNQFGSNQQSGGSTKRDPNGYSSMEKVVDAYFSMLYVQVVNRESFRKIYTEASWEYMSGELSFNKMYNEYVSSAQQAIDNYIKRFGDDYQLSWKIVSVEDTTNYRQWTEQERQDCIDMLGAEPDECFMYQLTVSVTGKGSKDEFTNPSEQVMVRKIAGKWYFY